MNHTGGAGCRIGCVKKQKHMPFFAGIVSWDDCTAILTEDISQGGKYKLIEPFDVLHHTHTYREHNETKQLVFVDPLGGYSADERMVFRDYLRCKLEIPEKMINMPD